MITAGGRQFALTPGGGGRRMQLSNQLAKPLPAVRKSLLQQADIAFRVAIHLGASPGRVAWQDTRTGSPGSGEEALKCNPLIKYAYAFLEARGATQGDATANERPLQCCPLVDHDSE